MLEYEYMPLLMINGISYNDFWSLTHKEIMRIAEKYVEEEKNKFRLQSEIAYIQAGMNAQARFGKLKQYASYFPDFEVKKEESADIALKNQLLQLAAQSKKKR